MNRGHVKKIQQRVGNGPTTPGPWSCLTPSSREQLDSDSIPSPHTLAPSAPITSILNARSRSGAHTRLRTSASLILRSASLQIGWGTKHKLFINPVRAPPSTPPFQVLANPSSQITNYPSGHLCGRRVHAVPLDGRHLHGELRAPAGVYLERVLRVQQQRRLRGRPVLFSS